MSDASVFIAGLPSAGKTTFLAALWHLIRSGEVATELSYAGLEGIDVGYLNSIQARWLEHKPMDRTQGSQEQTARLNLRARSGDRLTLSLPDFAGEGFRRMWSARRSTSAIASSASTANGHLFLINVDKIIYPRTVEEYRAELDVLGIVPGEPVLFDPSKCPTASVLADILVALEHAPVAARPRRVAYALTAWDSVVSENRSPEALLAERLPLLHQMLVSRATEVPYRVFGVSAQGMAYEDDDLGDENFPDLPSHRIQVVDGTDSHHDLTRLLTWLLG
ncbi:TRAFAC clade GTPase domain-containing protein [Sphingomonas sp.]|uniref:TRAFAC clade GTPase domain-containing protein n=1 Tax=Sphingomonas sp. TaxID=28214 RepID=UPI0028A6CC3F|nr:hypothetical protein [Sphingomonas sp.]